MYRTCIFCSGDLGTNDSVEEFPVGRTLAFDAGKGRLWAVCPKCARWNLAPIEERWEAVESSEKLFADARLRVQSENMGLAKLRDGTRLIRVGQALPGEMAAWRYGTQLVKRRRRYLAAGAVAVAGGAVWAGLAVTGVLGGAAGLTSVAVMAWQQYRGKRPVHRLSREESPTGEEIELNRFSLNAARVARGADGAIALHLPYALPAGPARWKDGRKVWFPERSLVLEGPTARTVLGRAMVDANSGGAGARRLDEALGLLGDAGGAEEYLRRAAGTGLSLGIPWLQPTRRAAWNAPRAPRPPMWWTAEARRDTLAGAQRVALEMALHEETERRAMAGELVMLESAWRDAEEIARIADALPGDPPELNA